MREPFQGKRTILAFIIGTCMVSVCLYWTRSQPENFTPLLTVWTGMMSSFLAKNYLQSKERKGDTK